MPTNPPAHSSASGGASRRSEATARSFSRTRPAALRIVPVPKTALREANVPIPHGVRPVSPSTIRTSSGWTPNASAATWANAVWWPCPCEHVPTAAVIFPDRSMETRALSWEKMWMPLCMAERVPIDVISMNGVTPRPSRRPSSRAAACRADHPS
jgi:hypothetical protein